MKKIITLIAVLTLSVSFGQTAIKKNNISTDGGSVSVGTTVIVYTVGELAVQENSVGSNHVSEGFVGSDLNALGVEDYGRLKDVKTFPNPVQTDLNILLPEYQHYELYLYDLNGKQLIKTTVDFDNNAILDLSMQKTGLYLLVIIDRQNKTTMTLKIQKQ